MNIIWLPRAEADLFNQSAWLQENRSGKAALKYLAQVNDAIERISNGTLVLYRLHDADRNIRACRINAHLMLYYRPLPNAIELLTIFDTRQHPGKLKV